MNQPVTAAPSEQINPGLPSLDALRRRHPSHQKYSARWNLLDALIEGGEKIDASIRSQLLANPNKRPPEVQAEIIKATPFVNKIAPILMRFNAQLFSKEPKFAGSEDKFWEEKFFRNGCVMADTGEDDCRCGFTALLAEASHNALSCGQSIAVVDLPRTGGEVLNRQAQKDAGMLDPYVTLHPRSSLWDFDANRHGFRFVKLYRQEYRQDSWDATPYVAHEFTIYQRQGEDENSPVVASRFEVRPIDPEKPFASIEDADDKNAVVVRTMEDTITFNDGKKFPFPVLTLSYPTKLCIGSQLLDCQRSYYNHTAGVEWATLTSNFSVPVVSGGDDEEEDPLEDAILSDGFYLQLPEGYQISWLERGGSTIATALNYRGEVKRDIYDQLQQIAMSAQDGSAIIARSGESKREDRRPEEILLSTYGLRVREFAKQLLDVASIARGESVEWDVQGFNDFLGAGLLEEAADIQSTEVVPIPSLTFKRRRAQFLAKKAGTQMGFQKEELAEIEKELAEASMEALSIPPAPPVEAPVS